MADCFLLGRHLARVLTVADKMNTWSGRNLSDVLIVMITVTSCTGCPTCNHNELHIPHHFDNPHIYHDKLETYAILNYFHFFSHLGRVLVYKGHKVLDIKYEMCVSVVNRVKNIMEFRNFLCLAQVL